MVSLPLGLYGAREVTVLAKQYAQRGAHENEIVSEIAGALWEWPPAVCGSHGKDTDAQLKNLQRWCQVSYLQFKNISGKFGAEDTGIRKCMSCFLFDRKLTTGGYVCTSSYMRLNKTLAKFYRTLDYLHHFLVEYS
ncbi:hypothetical protein K7432_010538 [Basidiobolus ranarum]|uniref:Uncharacterized protein n=1 Tax=Basidiobolus ranarum TaxID=34480 RepID=A0ABR2VW88_9FUNG